MSETRERTARSGDLPSRGSAALYDGFLDFSEAFAEITRRAHDRFIRRDWPGTQEDALARLELSSRSAGNAVEELRAMLGDRIEDRTLWPALKASYAARVSGRPDVEIAETFLNSVTRRVFRTVGVAPEIEFVTLESDLGSDGGESLYTTFRPAGETRALVRAILATYDFPYENAEVDAVLVAEELDRRLRDLPGQPGIDAVELVRKVLYRNKGAYLVGRMRCGAVTVPLVLSLLHGESGVVVDSVSLTEDGVSVIFSFTRSYFKVDVPSPRHLIAFLKSIMPLKRVAELYISIGYHKHGKTELYRDLLRHLASSTDRFELAKGERGMVMSVFTLPSYDFVFKIIKDRFPPPKSTSRREVMAKYQLVFRRDRAGRLVDAQEFEHLTFERARFEETLLTELTSEASGTVSVEGDTVVIKHLYAERRLSPLNLFINEAGPDQVRDAIVDYGQALDDLASSNIFPGDLLLKNFGVTRHGRVVFYDYDELCLLVDCNFRELPTSSDPDDEMRSEPSFWVGENDIFPEEFLTFAGMPGPLKKVFLAHHPGLVTAAYWREKQRRVAAGELLDLFPYGQARRLQRPAADGDTRDL